jgi:hypothetical protein
MLAASYTPQEINDKAWSLYADFRPTVDGWGARGEVSCAAILALRKKNAGHLDIGSSDAVNLELDLVRYETSDGTDQPGCIEEPNERECETHQAIRGASRTTPEVIQ